VRLDVWCQTDRGLKRTNNQDTFLLDPDLGLYIVADGMGGHLGGEVASALAAETVKDVIKQSFENDVGSFPRELIERSYREATHRVFKKSKDNKELEGMGTTMVVALFRDSVLYVGNVGDSRAYLIRPDGIWQLTEDHSLMNEHIRAGILKEENIANFGAKNVITRSVGFEDEVTCDVIERRIQHGEMVLICSDGLSGMVEDQEIYNLAQTNPPERLVQKLIEAAKANGGDDNVTVLLLRAKAEV
jgi:protein phosphatase